MIRMLALFQRTAEEVTKMGGALGDGVPLVSLASEFRKRMTEGQTIKKCNSFRKEFYDDVVERAKEVGCCVSYSYLIL